MRKPFVALVGRPNVGKSTLFNRLIGERLSVVDDRPGTTRDRIQSPVVWGGHEFILVDTGGIEPLEALRREDAQALATASADFVREIRAQAEIAIAEADALIFTVDAQAGLTAADEAVADILRKLIGQRQREGKAAPPVIVAASKADSYHLREASTEFYKLGLGEVYPVSGLHGIGTGTCWTQWWPCSRPRRLRKRLMIRSRSRLLAGQTSANPLSLTPCSVRSA